MPDNYANMSKAEWKEFIDTCGETGSRLAALKIRRRKARNCIAAAKSQHRDRQMHIYHRHEAERWKAAEATASRRLAEYDRAVCHLAAQLRTARQSVSAHEHSLVGLFGGTYIPVLKTSGPVSRAPICPGQ